jgi:hypothetical protein
MTCFMFTDKSSDANVARAPPAEQYPQRLELNLKGVDNIDDINNVEAIDGYEYTNKKCT